MSDDDKDIFGGLGDLDWDSALDAWEQKTFSPGATSKEEPPKGDEQKRPTAPPTAGIAEAAEPKPEKDKLESSGQGTVIAPVPDELRNSTRPPPPSSPLKHTPLPPIASARSSQLPPPASRGGLGQLFSRPPPRGSVPPPSTPPLRGAGPASADPLAPRIPPPPAPPRPLPSSEKTRVADPQELAKDIPPSTAPGESIAEMMERELAKGLSGSYKTVDHDSDRTLTKTTEEKLLAETREAAAAPLDLGDAPTVSKKGKDDEEDEATFVADRKKLEQLEALENATTSERLPADDEMDTIGRASGAPSLAGIAAAQPASIAPHTERSERPPAPEGPTTFEAERPASRWLDEKAQASYRLRAAWLEEEARALGDRTQQARALLAVSEILALASDMDRAAALAAEARDLAPQLALTWRQARQLLTDPDKVVRALDGEAQRSPTAAARAHATLLAADLLRARGSGDQAVARWESAYKLDPADVRAPVARVALALAQGEHTGGAFFLSENSELIALDRAVATVLRLRGHPRPGGEGQELPINDGLRKARTAFVAQDVVATAQALTEIASEPALTKAAQWLSASVGCAHIGGIL